MSVKFVNNNTIELSYISGIYVIINRKNNRFYIGESLNIKKRKDVHYSLLRNNKHYSVDLQNDFNLYGESAFEFKVILPHINLSEPQYTSAELLILENEFINRYKNSFNLYNKENSLRDIINSHNYHNAASRQYEHQLRSILLKILLNNKIEWIEDIPHIVPLPTLTNLFNISNKRGMINKILGIIPSTLKDAYTVKTIKYNNYKGVVSYTSTLVINDIEKFSIWLYEKNFITKEKYDEVNCIAPGNKDNMQNPSYQISQSKLYKKLKEEKIINTDFTYKEYKKVLLKNNILEEKEDCCVPTQYAINKGYIAKNDNDKIWFTELGELIIQDIVEATIK